MVTAQRLVTADQLTLAVEKLDTSVENLDTKLDTSVEKLNTKLDTAFEKLDTRISKAKLDLTWWAIPTAIGLLGAGAAVTAVLT